jgi:peroxidase
MAASFRIAMAVTCALVLASACQGLEVGYYKKTCPRVEAIVRDEVKKFVYKNAGIGAGLIRLIFHDCFVQVCTRTMNVPPSKCFYVHACARVDVRCTVYIGM